MNTYVELTKIGGHLIGLRPQICNGQRGEHLQLRSQLPRITGLVGACGRVRRGDQNMVPQSKCVPPSQRVGQRAVRADRRGGIGAIDPPDQDLVFTQRVTRFGEKRALLTMRNRSCSIRRTAFALSDNASASFTIRLLG